MARTSSIRYYHKRGAYYTCVNGKQFMLAKGPKDDPHGPNFAHAKMRFARLGLGAESEEPIDTLTVGSLISRHLFKLRQAALTDPVKRKRLAVHQHILNAADVEIGLLQVRQLRPSHIDAWFRARTTWSVNTQNNALRILGVIFNRAVKEGEISSNPLKRVVDRPPMRARGKEVVLSEDLAALLIAEAPPHLRQALTFLAATGCRPGELYNARGTHYRPEVPCILFPHNPPPGEYRWKCARTRRDRVIHLTPVAAQIVADAVKRNGDGPLFTGATGKAYGGNSLSRHIWDLKRKPAVAAALRARKINPRHVTAYSFRHTYITARLNEGTPIKLLADFTGTSVGEIERTYGHGHEELTEMRRLFLHYASS